uniref:Ig-like domain-containing protein n=1 Tax=Knipowitschia caucasica TaxID=637954 RepID=A0AAV2M0Z9_KNICA
MLQWSGQIQPQLWLCLQGSGPEAERQRESRQLLEKQRQVVKALQSNCAAAHSRAQAAMQREQQCEEPSLQREQQCEARHEREQQCEDARPQREQCKEARLQPVMKTHHKRTSKERSERQNLKSILGEDLKEQQLFRRKQNPQAVEGCQPGGTVPPALSVPSPPLYLRGDSSDSSDSSDNQDTTAPEHPQQQDEEDQDEAAGGDLELPEFSGMWAHGYKDFEVKQRYKRKVVLTNVSYSSSECRLTGLSAALSSCMSVRVICSPKKSQVEVDSVDVDLGSSVVGETVTRSITLTNRGALGCEFKLDMGDQGEQRSVPPLRPMVTEGFIGPFQSIKLELAFKGTVPGVTTHTVYIHSSDCSRRILVQVKATVVSVPVWASPSDVEMKICLWDECYHHCLCVHSRASTALRLTFEVAPGLRKYMEVVPKTGFVQAQSSFKALLKFQPRRSLVEEAGKMFDQDTGVLETPVEVHVAGQTVRVTVSAVLTCSDLTLDTQELDFGPCSVHQAIRSSVYLSNMSLLPQDYGFCRVPEFLEVLPHDGFGTLLPQETRRLDVVFRPRRAQDYSCQLYCRTGLSRELKLACRGIGVRPPLKLSHTSVQFGATVVGHVSSALVHLINTEALLSAAGPRLFSFQVPDHSMVSVCPCTGQLQPGEHCLIQLTFRPSLCEAENGSDTGTQAEVSPAEGSRAVQRESPAGLPQSQHHGHLTLTCCVSDATSGSSEQAPSWSPLNMLWLMLQYPIIQPPLLVTSGTSVTFHPVAVGETALHKCFVQNISEESLDLGSSLLSVEGAFSVVNALRPLAPGHTHTLLLSFCPRKAMKYCEQLELRSQRGSLWLCLRGQGLQSEVSCSTSDPEMDFGHVLLNDRCSRTVTLQNTSAVEVGYRTLLSSQTAPLVAPPPPLVSGDCGESVFTVQPAGGRLSPGQSVDLRICFHPKAEREFRARLTVQLSDQSVVCETDLQGAAWSKSIFVSGGDRLCTQAPGTATPPVSEASPMLVTLTGAGAGSKGSVVRELKVGYVRSTLPNKKNVEFVWEDSGCLQGHGFSIEPSRGAVEPGTTCTVSLTWTPPAGYKPHDVLQSHVFLRANSVTLYNVTLMGMFSS